MAQLPAIVAGHGGSGTSTTITIAAAAAGNVLILFFGNNRAAGARTITSIATTNVTWAKLVQSQSAGLNTEFWAGVVSGGSSGTTVTLTLSGSASTIACRIDEFTGVAIVGNAVVVDPVVQGQSGFPLSNNGSNNAPNFVSAISPNTGDLLLALMVHLDGTAPTAQPPSPWVATTFVSNGTAISTQGNYVPNGATDNNLERWLLSGNVPWGTLVGALKSTAGFQADFIKTRDRTYESPFSEITPQRRFVIPTPSVVDDLSWKRLLRLYESPIADLYPRPPFAPWLTVQQFDRTEYWIPPKRLYESPDPDPGGRRGKWLPDNSGLGGDQVPKVRLFRSYESPDADLGGRRGKWLPDNSSLGNDQTSHLKTARLYIAPDADLGGRRGKWLPDNSSLGGDQTSHLKTFRFYVAPDADLGGRRGVWLPDNSGLGGDQIPYLRLNRLYESPTAEIYPSRAFSQATASQVADQLGWIRLNRLGAAALAAEVFAARTMLFSAAAETTALEEERVRVGGFTGIQVPDIYVGGV